MKDYGHIPLQRVLDILAEGPISAANLAARLNITETKAAELLNKAMLWRSSQPEKKEAGK